MKKIFILILCTMIVLSPKGVKVLAAEITNAEVIVNQNEMGVTLMRADVIEYKFRELNGRAQYRRWNATKKYWVDPYWIYV